MVFIFQSESNSFLLMSSGRLQQSHSLTACQIYHMPRAPCSRASPRCPTLVCTWTPAPGLPNCLILHAVTLLWLTRACEVHNLFAGGERHVAPCDDVGSSPGSTPWAAAHKKPPTLVHTTSSGSRLAQTAQAHRGGEKAVLHAPGGMRENTQL